MIGVFLTGCIFVFVITFLFLYKYGNLKETNLLTLAVVFVCTFFPFSVLYLLPIDLSTTDYAICKNTTTTTVAEDPPSCKEPAAFVDPSVIYFFWYISYWLSQLGTWVVIPILSQYSDSGFFTVRGRVWHAVKANLIYYCVLGVLGIGFIMYLVIGLHFDTKESLMSFLMAMANAYGMVLLVSFMGHGLVDVPRSIWKQSFRNSHLRSLEFKAPILKDEVDDYAAEYDDAKQELLWVSKQRNLPSDVDTTVKKLMEKFPLNSANISSRGHTMENVLQPSQINMKHLAGLNRRLKKGKLLSQRGECQWNNFLWHIFLIQDIIRNENNSVPIFSSITRNRSPSTLNNFLAKVEYVYFIYLEPWIFRIISLILAALSLAIIWSELTLFATDSNGNKKFSIFALIIHGENTSSSIIEAVSFVTVFYMSVCSYTSLAKLRLFKEYVIVSENHTDARTLLFFAAYLNRLSFPLCYNFLNLVGQIDGQVPTRFSLIMGKIDLLPLFGQKFNAFVPILMGVICFLVAFRLYSRVLHLLGIQEFFFGTNDGEELQDGRELIDRARKSAEKNSSTVVRSLDHELGQTEAGTSSSMASRSVDVASRNAEFYSKYGDRLKKVREKHNYGGEANSDDRDKLLGAKRQ